MFSKIIKRDGRIVDFDVDRIKSAVHKAFLAVELEDGTKAEKITCTVVSLLESRFKDVTPSVEDVQDVVIRVLRKEGYEKVAFSYADFRKKKEELRALRGLLGIEPKLTINAIEILRARYLLRDEQGNLVETPPNMFKRVAKAIAQVDAKFDEDSQKSEELFYDMMAKLEFLPNTPTLFNAGTSIGQLSACFVLPVDDSLGSIFDTLKNMAIIEQTGGGVGFDFSKLRPKGDIVKSTKGVASGPVSFMRIFDSATEVIKAGGKRRGAMMAILRVDHPDIMDFVTVKQNPAMLSNFNISVAVTDEFIKALRGDKTYWLINPRNNEKIKQLKATEVWNIIAHSAWVSGDPGVVFIDEINRHNPTPQVGKIESTNPCMPSDTWIMTQEGARQVRDLHGKAFVAIVNGQTWNGSNEGFFLTGVKPICRLVTKEGFEVRLTKNHPVLKVKELSRHKINTEWVKTGDLTPEDKIVLNNHYRIAFWGGKYSENEGYFIGSILGNSPLTTDNGILSGWNDNYTSKMVNVPICSYTQEIPSNLDFCNRVTVRDENKYNITTGCIKKMVKEISLPSNAKVVTKEMEEGSSSFCKGLIKGLFDAAGYIQENSENVSIRIIQSNIILLKAVQRILLRFGIFSTICARQQVEAFSPPSNSKIKTKNYPSKFQYELIISNINLLTFEEKIGFENIYKAVKLKKITASRKNMLKKEHFIATLVKIETESEEEVYDVVIPGINMFDANGFCVHNCGEQPLLPYESCNLGSINLSKMVKKGTIDWAKLRETVRKAVHFLDNVVDTNIYPLKDTADVTLANRKIGLGVMGFADLLIMLGVPYDSDDALSLGEQIMQFIQSEAHQKSSEIAERRGSFPNFKGSIWEQRYSAFRNATVTTIAPTGTISIIAGCSSGIEPLFAVSFMRNVLNGTRLFETNPLFEVTAKVKGFYNAKLLEEIARTGSVRKIKYVPEEVKRIFVTALDIAPIWHIKMQAAFQKNTDNAVSKTVNLPYNAKVEDVRAIYDLAWQLKCKGVTVFRYGSKPAQVLYIGEIKTKDGKFVSAQSEYAGGCPTQNCPFPA